MTTLPAERLLSAGRIAAEACFGETEDEALARFDALYAAYRPFLRKIAIGKFGIPPDDAEDLVQDVFATYIANGNVYNPHNYLIGAICNASRQWRRRDKAAPTFLELNHETCGATDHDEIVDDVVKNIIIGACLAKLGDKCRDALRRFHLLGESAVSIAHSRNMTANYICRLLSYCRGRAREMYLQMNGGTKS